MKNKDIIIGFLNNLSQYWSKLNDKEKQDLSYKIAGMKDRAEFTVLLNELADKNNN